MRLRYDVVDVFTDRPFAGNQLAVVHGADDLNAEQCLALTREFNFSETTFPASGSGPAEYANRIFTPGGEIPFAGHPTLGTAWVLRSLGRFTTDEVTQLCGAGRIGVRFDDESVELTADPRDRLGPVDAATVSGLLGDLDLTDDDLAGEAWVAGCGLSFVHLPVVADAIGRARPTGRPFTERREQLATLGHAQDPIEGINLVHVSGVAPQLTVRARVFVPGLAVPEDPATGSAAAGLGIALVATGQLPEGGSYQITQGVELGRPSQLHGRVEVSDGSVRACRVAGQVHHIATGEITVPSFK
jgi:trans-2,3-dihydro-3-hydroxyanthranilate isomerase